MLSGLAHDSNSFSLANLEYTHQSIFTTTQNKKKQKKKNEKNELCKSST